MRYARVQQVLAQELAFRERLSDKTEAILKPNGSPELFSPEVIKITQAIHDSGKDAHKCQKIDVIRVAVKVFGIGESAPDPTPTPEAPPPPSPPPTPPPSPAPEVQAKKNGAPHADLKPKAAAKPKPVAKAPSKPKSVPTAAAPPAPVVEPPSTPIQQTATVQVVVETPAKAEKPEKEAVVKAAADAFVESRPSDEKDIYSAYISMYSLTLSTIQLCEMFDKLPGSKDRLKKLEELVVEFKQHASLKSAKEAKKA
jgi:hypothetical protein